MNKSVKTAIELLRVGETPDLGVDIAKVPLQQREAMVELICQAILSGTGSLRAGNSI